MCNIIQAVLHPKAPHVWKGSGLEGVIDARAAVMTAPRDVRSDKEQHERNGMKVPLLQPE